MPTHTPQSLPSSPSSHTRALWPADPAPLHWPAPMVDSRAMLAARLAAAPMHPDVRAAVDACVALCPEAAL